MKRHLITILIFLVAGALANVAVAWLCALRVRELATRKELHELPTEAESIWGRYAKAGWPSAPTRHFVEKDGSIGTMGGTRKSVRFGVTDVSLSVSQISPAGGEIWHVMEIRAGWPVRSFKAGFRRYYAAPLAMVPLPIETQTFGGFLMTVGTLPPSPGFGPATPIPDERLVPYMPIWHAFVVNSLIYAGVLFLVFRGANTLRRQVRIWRGRCPNCGYPVGLSLICSECGRPLPSRARPAT
jgi:hypothetical protein